MANFDRDGKTLIRVPFQIFLDKEIGKGSNGTVVYQGAYPRRSREVAVKCFSEDQFNSKRQGYELLGRWGDGCAHIDSLFAIEEAENLIYAMVTLCDHDLHHLVKNEWLYAGWLEENGYPKPCLLKLMSNIVDGLQYLHAERIIYGDLNPSHMLIYEVFTARLSIVGTCRRLAKDETSLRSDATVSGTPGWQSPEQILNLPQTPAMDLFNLGCVFFFILTQGKHPFGERSENNVANNNIVNLSLVEHIPEAKHLISRLLEPEPQLRPKASEILRYPLFWNSFKRMSFLRDASLRANGNEKGVLSIAEALERDAPRVFLGTFNGLIASECIAEMEYRPYRCVGVRQLLHRIRIKVAVSCSRALEKKATHLGDPLDDMLEEVDHYVRRRFPNLLMVVYDVMLDSCKEEDWLEPYLPYKRIY